MFINAIYLLAWESFISILMLWSASSVFFSGIFVVFDPSAIERIVWKRLYVYLNVYFDASRWPKALKYRISIYEKVPHRSYRQAHSNTINGALIWISVTLTGITCLSVCLSRKKTISLSVSVSLEFDKITSLSVNNDIIELSADLKFDFEPTLREMDFVFFFGLLAFLISSKELLLNFQNRH